MGYIPLAPGTFGSLVALPLFYLSGALPTVLTGVLICALTVAAVGIAGQAEKWLNTKDPGCIVIDEIAGQLVTLAGLPVNGYVILGGFLVFRCLDIIKPFPINWLEKRLTGGLGIVADDILAGVIGNILLRCILFFWAV